MKKDFVGYNEVLELEKLGFDNYSDLIRIYQDQTGKIFNPDFAKHSMNDLDDFRHNKEKNYLRMVLWQQAFDWFKEKHSMTSWIYTNNEYQFNIDFGFGIQVFRKFYSQEETQLECIKKLIELVYIKKKKDEEVFD